jgi:hypothetical protein
MNGQNLSRHIFFVIRERSTDLSQAVKSLRDELLDLKKIKKDCHVGPVSVCICAFVLVKQVN